MKITNSYIKSLNPCQERYDNYLSYYKNTEFSIVEFLKLDKISYDDKLWVWRHLATKDEAVVFAHACANSVLHLFETQYPDDKRPRLALEAVKAYMDGPSEENKLKCVNAARAAYAVAAVAYAADAAVAYAAADAVAYAADAVADAAVAARAAYAVADAAVAVAYAAADAAVAYAAIEAQQNLNLSFLIEIYEKKEKEER